MSQSEKYLLPEDDGLRLRKAKMYVHYKLEALRHYLTITNNAMWKQWPDRWYIDLEAGPGKNIVGESVILGSPLIALTVPNPATRLIFNELRPRLNNALRQRVQASPLRERVTIFQGDVNEVVATVCEEIVEQDRKNALAGKWSTLNVAFLDPKGLELHWSTVEKLARMKKMDLIINFSTSGIKREIGAKDEGPITRFFGTPEWRSIYDGAPRNGRSRALIDFYRQNLEKFGYYIDIINTELGGHDIVVKNSKNAPVYSMIFASKNPLGDKFWKSAGSATQPKLPGLD